MGKRDETFEFLKQGFTPGQIARKMGVSLQTTLGYLDQMVGEGCLRYSDILFSVPVEKRRSPTDPADVQVIERYGDAAHAFGDLYQDLSIIEVTLHNYVRKTFEAKFGNDWWRQGVPEKVRIDCVVKREQDSDPAEDSYCYTDLIDLRAIFDKQWVQLSGGLSTAISSDKPRFMADLNRLNSIRRKVMHPVRGAVPEEEDFEFLKELKQRLGIR